MKGVMGSVKIALVGAPNVGKSLLFNRLTGRYAAVSNYPGTTVEITRGEALMGQRVVEVVDTPGTYSLLPVTGEEAVTRRLLWDEEFSLLLHVVDTKNLERALPLTLMLMEAGFRLILVLNMYDEAERLDMAVDCGGLSRRLAMPVVATVGTTGRGVAELREEIGKLLTGSADIAESLSLGSAVNIPYPPPLRSYLQQVTGSIRTSYPFSSKTIALLALEDDREVLSWLRPRDARIIWSLASEVREASHDYPLLLAEAYRQTSARVLAGLRQPPSAGNLVNHQWLHTFTTSPVTGLAILVLVLYLFLYRFVGVFGAGTLVDFLDGKVFADLFNPFVNHVVDSLIPYRWMRELLAHDFGILTLGLRYAVAVVFPIVTTFFLSFALLEDSGYLPRLAYLLDRTLKPLGLSGKAVIPLTIGFGCGTMAVLVTRTLDTSRERMIATAVLAASIPCSAQLGVIMALLAQRPLALLIWGLVVASIALITSTLLNHLLPGEPPSFILELPPLRRPVLSNVIRKTTTRVSWYFMEIMPLFLLASVLIWIGRETGGLDKLLAWMMLPMEKLGLPPQVAQVFIFGFFRRDYGAAGLYDMQDQLSMRQLTVAAVTLTLFLPCVAQFIMIIKERGMLFALAVAACVFPLAFSVGMLLNRLLALTGLI